jgi:hypothetical protein
LSSTPSTSRYLNSQLVTESQYILIFLFKGITPSASDVSYVWALWRTTAKGIPAVRVRIGGPTLRKPQSAVGGPLWSPGRSPEGSSPRPTGISCSEKEEQQASCN